MSFTPNIPLATQSLGQTRQSIVDNQAILRSTIAVDHVDVNASGNGKHKWARFPSQSSGIPATIASEIMLVAKSTNLFIRQGNSSNDVQLAFGNLSLAETALLGTNTAYSGTNVGGWTFLPGGLMLQYGTRPSSNNPGTTTITFPISFGSSANVYSVQVTAFASAFGATDDLTAAVRSISGSGNSMLIGTSSSGNVTDFYWVAIGKKP